jgi:hypothetical protein
MDYVTWRNDVFGQQPDSDPVMLDLLPEMYEVLPNENFDHIDRALDDSEIHDLYSRDQIGIGLQLIYRIPVATFVFATLKRAMTCDAATAYDT